jgi:predicted CXXCH cytochrome family protein
MTGSSAAILQSVPTAIPESWMPRARFDHRSHQLATCTSCHTTAATSTETSDVLMPAIATCQQCHSDNRRAADARCFVCHDYHDWKQPASPAPAGFAIADLR